MAKRQIIKIDETKCDGCGECVPNCPEGALQIIDGKARLVGELLCDGLGACIGNCPSGAITVEMREAVEYDELKALENIVKAGPKVLSAHIAHLKKHSQDEYLQLAYGYLKKNNIAVLEDESDTLACGCPGTMSRDFRNEKTDLSGDCLSQPIKSELRQWPTQLKLLNPNASYFNDCELVVAADCVPFTFADFHRRFLKGKSLVMFCPKLDNAMDEYLEKLTAIIRNNRVKAITIVKMEVPCCGGTAGIVENALKQVGKNIIVKEYTISIRGEIV